MLNMSNVIEDLIVSSEPSQTFHRGSGRPFTTVDVKNLFFWVAYSLQGLFDC